MQQLFYNYIFGLDQVCHIAPILYTVTQLTNAKCGGLD